MITECCECDRPAFAFHGRYAYCPAHWMFAQNDSPDEHKCPRCIRKQPPHVMWRGDQCGQCSKEIQFPEVGRG